QRAAELGDYFKRALRDKLSAHLPITEIRGMGLMIGVELNDPIAGEIVGKCLKNGLLCGTAGPKVLRFLPPYIIEKQDIDLACEIITHSISQ
ncbi:aminotransferase class III-fold pyridoxal phosphate-dependent enzyme, partial [bacterium]|nr:aminotransferase class III-fold pyridoxal phosphate-dependent enzyme [bacterium]